MNLAIIDANPSAGEDRLASVTAGWLAWEIARAGIEIVAPGHADVVFVVYPGAVDWSQAVGRSLRRHGLAPQRSHRQRPYVIAGGAVDATPLTALRIANAVAVGEGYRFVRTLTSLVREGCNVADISAWIREYPHAIEASQIDGMERDAERPWLMARIADPLASPDDYVDWTTPPVRCDDQVVRIQASRGCRGRCAYCATTWRQRYAVNPNSNVIVSMVSQLERRGERVQLITNDAADLPYYGRLRVATDSQSYTIRAVLNPAVRRSLIARPPKMARFGVEGLSERIRLAFGKPIPNQMLLDLFDDLQTHRVPFHAFFIPCAPYETAEDVDEFRSLYRDLARLARYGVSRIKLTTFTPTPPAPLARFSPSFAVGDPRNEIVHWVARNCASRHIVLVAGSSRRGLVRRVAEQLSIPTTVARQLLESDTTVDLAPTLDDYRRLPPELIAWPVAAAIRYKIGEVYRRRMGGHAA